MRGPDHGATDPAKAFADWDEAVSHLLYLGEVTLTSADTGVVACVGTLATAPTSAESRDALRIYHAAIHDLTTPAQDIAFLRGVLETERQADFDRADPVAYAARTGTPYHDFSDED